MSDDRFTSESTVFNPPPKPHPEWDEAMSPEEYFRRSFEAGNQNFSKVQKLRQFFPRLYEKVEKEFQK